MTDEARLRVQIDAGRSVSASHTRASASTMVVVYAPGAGSNLSDPFGAFLAERLAGAGIDTLRFQFPYSEAGRSAPDRPPVLEATWRTVLDVARSLSPRVVPSGRSMGGRIASQVIAQGETAAALALFAYPLHPPGRPEQLRDAHLASIPIPTLFCCGTRDDFGTPAELANAAAKPPDATLHLLEGADHGFNVLKSSGRARHDVWAEAVDTLLAFLEAKAG